MGSSTSMPRVLSIGEFPEMRSEMVKSVEY